MKKRWKWTAALIGLSLAVGCLGGCGGKNAAGSDKTLTYYVVGTESKDSGTVMEQINNILEEKVGVTLNFRYLDAETYDLALSSGDSYDLIYAPDWLNYWENVEKGAFAEISEDDLKNNAPYIWEHGQKYLFAAKSNGKLYGIPSMREYAPDRCYVARGDLMDKYGIAALDSVEDVDRYLTAVAENETDIIPFDMPGNTPYFMLNMFANDWGWGAVGTVSFGEHVYFDVNDPSRKLFLAVDDPRMKEFSYKMKEWNDKGVFSRSVLSNTTSSEESFRNGRSALAWTSNPESCNNIWNDFQKDDRQAWDVRFYPVYSTTQRMYNYMNNCVAVSAFSRNKETALKVVDEFYSNEELYRLFTYGVKGVHYDVDSEGNYVVLDAESYTAPGIGVYNDAMQLPVKLDFPGAQELKAKLESYRVADPLVNCNMDNESLREIKLALDEVYANYTSPRCYGAVDDVDQALAEEREQLIKAGVEQYMETIQARVDEYMASLDE